MTFKEARAALTRAGAVFCKPGTERVAALCERLGSPEDHFRAIHVTGTNGKGSTSRMIEGFLRAGGYRTGQFASPYLFSPTECIRIDGVSISARRFAHLTERVLSAAEGMTDQPTEFELITVIAFLAFYEAGVEVAVVEVCMGGRTDATNVIKSPALSVITGVSLDHTAYLGSTVAAIAKEKAGIIKQGCPLLYGGEDGDAYRVIQEQAVAKGAPFYRTSPEKITLLSASTEGSRFTYRESAAYSLPLLGIYQVKNAALALDAASLLRKEFPRIDEEAIRRAFSTLAWEGRFERLSTHPPVYFDGAHNPCGVLAAKESIAAYFPNGVLLVSGILADKDYTAVTSLLAPHVREAFTVTPKSPRALSAREYAKAFHAAGVSATPMRSVGSALAHAVAEAQRLSLPVLCIGSLYLYAAIRKEISKMQR